MGVYGRLVGGGNGPLGLENRKWDSRFENFGGFAM